MVIAISFKPKSGGAKVSRLFDKTGARSLDRIEGIGRNTFPTVFDRWILGISATENKFLGRVERVVTLQTAGKIGSK
jgi:hypothetical protein